ncbi:hypothetical protein OKA05_27325 [Luteolibacter arcticus]|uniref:Uncharacterized protein n=1 Tax=Luteolibacter arcticus TaxID=1581411 RepID=A0ABT3GRZ0_9BACT|nr:hypothetical protein [Luteolibacter arcticus]
MTLALMYPAGFDWSYIPRSPSLPIEFKTFKQPGFAVRICHLAHWFLILLFLIPWTAYLTWRHQRMKRQAPGTAEP